MTTNAGTQRAHARRRPLAEWWAEFNEILRARGLHEACFAIARPYWAEGCSVVQAVEREAAIQDRLQAA